MQHMLVFSRIKKESELLIERFRSLLAYETEAQWQCVAVETPEKAAGYLESGICPDVSCFDIACGTELAEKTRRSSADAIIILIVEANVSPVVYIRPAIMASGVVIRPAEPYRLDDLFKDVLKVFREKALKQAFGGAVFSLESRSGLIKIPYADILFFEAREKKVFLVSRAFEQGFYATLDSLEKELPEQFFRCHKSFIINLKVITKVSFPENRVILCDTADIPVSRSYKALLKEALK